MKKRNVFSIILAVLLVVLACVTMSACDLTEQNPKGDKYTVTFKNGDTVVSTLTDIEKGTQLTAEQIPTLDNVPEDKEFAGWFVGEGDNAVKVEAGYTVNGEVVAVAKLTDKQSGDTDIVTVTFEGEGVTTPSQSVIKGDTALEPNDPDRGVLWRFDGWFYEGEKFDFNTPITEDITLVAQWTSVDPTSMTGSGTKEDPYVLWSANDIINFAARVNTPSTPGNEGYYRAYYRLGKDIDMTGITNYTPAGISTSYEDKNGDDVSVNGFEGVFDGNGFKISNLTLTRTLRSGLSNVGFFGMTYMAVITNVTFENIHYIVESGADVGTIGTYFGGVVGYATLTNFFGVKVDGTIEARLFESNVASIGGIAGIWNVYDSEEAYIAYTENCYANVSIISGAFSDFDGTTSLVGAMVGGLHGYIHNSGSAAAIINSATSGSIAGGQYVAGLAAYLDSDSVSIINCASNMSVRATAVNTSSFAGGLIGATSNNVILMDSVFFGSVRGTRPSGTYSGYAGALVGYAAADDYNMYYTAGIAVANCYFKANLRDVQNRTTYGVELSEAPTLEWAISALGWDEESWTEDFIPTNVYAADLRSSASLTLANGNQNTSATKEIAGKGGYSLVGIQDVLSNTQGNVFYDWEIAAGVGYRYFMPIVKDVTLTARWQDVSSIVGVYAGTYEFHVTGDAGIIQIKDDGTCQWIQLGSVNGVYRYDGEHIVFTFYNVYDEVSGTLRGGRIEFVISQGVSGDVDYTFEKSELKYFGDYYSADGDSISFGGADRVSINSTIIGSDYYNATYVENGNTLTLTSTYLADKYSSMTMTVNEDLSITVNFVGIDPSKSINKTFTKIGTPDYTGEAFVGSYVMAYLASGGDPYQSIYQINLNADGSASLVSAVSGYEVVGFYYVFGDTVKMSLESNMSTFTFNEEEGILYGLFNRGSGRKLIAIKVDGGVSVENLQIRAFVIDNDITSVVYITGDQKYLMLNGEWKSDAEIVGTFEDDTTVTIDGVEYLTAYMLYNKNERYKEYLLAEVGDEAGTYTRGGLTLELNGIGVVKGDASGFYMIYDNLVVVLLEDDTLFAFDYTAAQAAGGAITDAVHDGYQGVWYYDRLLQVNLWEPDGTQENEKSDLMIVKYYKFVVDGFGHTTIIYYSYDYQEYRYNWSAIDNTGWGVYSINATGISVYYNEAQTGDVVFYYDMGLAYSRSLGYIGEISFYKEGYTGVMTPPSLPAGVAGSYTGAESGGTAVVFNLRADLTGSYKGVPFISIYDGLGHVNFSIDGVDYAFDVNTKVITYGSESVTLTLSGDITEIIPASLCGEWTGVVTGYGMPQSGTVQTFSFNSDGTLVYNEGTFDADYDAFTNTITASGSFNGNEYTFEFKYNDESETFTLSFYRGEHTYSATLSRA